MKGSCAPPPTPVCLFIQYVILCTNWAWCLMECERVLITPIFILMAPSSLINDDKCHTEKGTVEMLVRIYANVTHLLFEYFGVCYDENTERWMRWSFYSSVARKLKIDAAVQFPEHFILNEIFCEMKCETSWLMSELFLWKDKRETPTVTPLSSH